MIKVLNFVAVVVVSIVMSIERSHKELFKGGIALLVVYLIGISQSFPVVLEQEHTARQLKFEFEEASGLMLNEAKCIELNDHQAICRLAKYKEKAVRSASRFVFELLNLAMGFGIFLLFLAAIGLVSKLESDAKRAAKRRL